MKDNDEPKDTCAPEGGQGKERDELDRLADRDADSLERLLEEQAPEVVPEDPALDEALRRDESALKELLGAEEPGDD